MKAKYVRPGLEKRALVVRLRKIKGQIEGIEKMVEADADCSDVLMQVVSARQALKSFSEKMIESHMRECIESTASRSESRRESALPAHGFETIRRLKLCLSRKIPMASAPPIWCVMRQPTKPPKSCNGSTRRRRV